VEWSAAAAAGALLWSPVPRRRRTSPSRSRRVGLARNSWPDVTKYSQFLRNRHVDYVIIFGTYDREWRTNEHQLLRQLQKQGPDRCDADRVGVHEVSGARTFDVYQIRRDC
jgi:hypothetical protein